MTARILGIQTVDYVSKKDNKQRTGVKVFISRKPTSHEPDVVGEVTSDIYIPTGTPDSINLPSFKVGCYYDFNYEFDGKYNYLSSISEIKQSA